MVIVISNGTAHAETTPVVQEPSLRDMTGEAHSHTPRCNALMTIQRFPICTPLPPWRMRTVREALSRWSLSGTFDACQGSKEQGRRHIVIRHRYASMGRSECVASPCIAADFPFSCPTWCLPHWAFASSAVTNAKRSRRDLFAASLSIDADTVNTDMWRLSPMHWRSSSAAAQHRSKCELSRPISREIAASYGPGLAAALLTLHVRMAISGGRKLLASTSYQC